MPSSMLQAPFDQLSRTAKHSPKFNQLQNQISCVQLKVSKSQQRIVVQNNQEKNCLSENKKVTANKPYRSVSLQSVKERMNTQPYQTTCQDGPTETKRSDFESQEPVKLNVNHMKMIDNLDAFLEDSSSDEFDPTKHYHKKEPQQPDNDIGLNLLRQRSNKFAPIQTNSIKK